MFLIALKFGFVTVMKKNATVSLKYKKQSREEEGLFSSSQTDHHVIFILITFTTNGYVIKMKTSTRYSTNLFPFP